MHRVIDTSDLSRRARIHAALGEPVRLAIAELLIVSDCAPTELARRLGVPTNLLAHHLGVMEETGLVRRRRSEGDGRRSYVQLALNDRGLARLVDPGQAATIARSQPARVVFVCTHNSARSQLASAAWRRVSRVPSASSGTHPAERVHRRAVVTGRRHGLSLDGATTTDFRDCVQHDDLVVAVCDRAHEELPALTPDGTRVRMHWSVPDPVPLDTAAAFESAYRDISRRVDRLAAVVTAPSGIPKPTRRARPRRPS